MTGGYNLFGFRSVEVRAGIENDSVRTPRSAAESTITNDAVKRDYNWEGGQAIQQRIWGQRVQTGWTTRSLTRAKSRFKTPGFFAESSCIAWAAGFACPIKRFPTLPIIPEANTLPR